jgi:hypothetical protein
MKHANVTQTFLDDVSVLPTTYDYDTYLAFIFKYGTHYLRNAVFGGRITAQSTISISQMGTLQAANINVPNGLRIIARYMYSIADESANQDYVALQANNINVAAFRKYTLKNLLFCVLGAQVLTLGFIYQNKKSEVSQT